MAMRTVILCMLVLASFISANGQNTPQEGGRRGGRAAQARQNREEAKAEPAANAKSNGGYVVGKNRFTTVVNGDTREYYVHVPKSYNKNTSVPLVFMLHGTSGDGLKFYNISGWKEVGETENIITVYPSAFVQCVIDEGVKQNISKWSSYPDGFTYCDGVTPRDDIKFLTQVLNEVEKLFNINKRQVYFVGFSNGGQMTARVGIEMSEVVAGFVGHLGVPPTVQPKRIVPNIWQEGTEDPHYTGMFGGQSVPMDFNQILAKPYMKSALNMYMKTFKLNPKYTTGGDPNNIIYLDAKGTMGNTGNIFRLAFVKDLEHEYPNGKNHPVHGAELNWQWLKQFKLP